MFLGESRIVLISGIAITGTNGALAVIPDPTARMQTWTVIGGAVLGSHESIGAVYWPGVVRANASAAQWTSGVAGKIPIPFRVILEAQGVAAAQASADVYLGVTADVILQWTAQPPAPVSSYATPTTAPAMAPAATQAVASAQSAPADFAVQYSSEAPYIPAESAPENAPDSVSGKPVLQSASLGAGGILLIASLLLAALG